MAKKLGPPKFVVCVSSKGSDDLQVWKLYRVLPDAAAAAEGYVRVVDDSGEDYLYPATRFAPVTVSVAVQRKLMAGTPSVA